MSGIFVSSKTYNDLWSWAKDRFGESNLVGIIMEDDIIAELLKEVAKKGKSQK